MANYRLTSLSDYTGTAVKRCSRCGECKSRDEFCVRARALDGLQPWCRACFSSYNREKKYKLTADEINKMLAGGCEVCGAVENLCIDHCHNSQQVRGVLCDWCNRALGLLRDDAEQVMALAVYRDRFDG